MRRVAIAFAWIAAGWVAAAAAHGGAGTHGAGAGTVTSVQAGYAVPAVPVVDTRGRTVPLARALQADAPQVVNFIYTTCSTICSTQTATLAELQRKLEGRGRRARFVSFTIDPDNDTPQRLAAFARQFSIARDWDFYSGEYDHLLRVQQAFDVYRGAKAAHPPVVLMRRSPGAPWLRVEGYPTASELLALFERLPDAVH